MDNILLADIGNTSIKWALKDSNNLLEMSQQRYPNNVSDVFFVDCLGHMNKPDRVFVTCVAGAEVWQAFADAIHSLWSIKVERVISKSNGYGVINGYEKSSELGSDRWCALLGAHHAADSDVVVIDCGSAITVDIVKQSGEHVGGYILPGLSMMKESLGLHTAQVKVNAPSSESNAISPAYTTTGCVAAGINLAAVSVIEAVIKQQRTFSDDLKCFLTGGDADSIAEHLTIEYVNMPNLVIRGLAVIAEDNQEQKNS